MNLENKVVVITGAGSGIGRCLAIQLEQKGCKLALSDVNEAGLAETIAQLKNGEQVKSDNLNVANEKDFFEYADDVITHFGRVDAVINNAGVVAYSSVEECSLDIYKWVMDINVMGTLYGTKAFLPCMKKQGSGQIVNISSIFGIISAPDLSAYHMSKFAVRGLNECLWSELKGTGVDCISIHPGGIKTNLIEGGRSSSKEASDKMKRFGKLFVTTPEVCAAKIIKGMEKKQRRVLIGADAKIFSLLSRLLPNSYHKVFNLFLESKLA